MTPGLDDTIAAIATAPGAGGVAIIRISGPRAIAIAEEVLGGRRLPDRQVVVGRARDTDGPLDTVVAFAMRGPRSFTGEDVAELQGHGGAVNSGRLLRAVLAAGARAAEPGEFTRRAFVHGKLDLTQAEALAAMIGAASERAWRVARDQVDGALREAIAVRRAAVIEVLAELEAWIDFPDEGIAAAADLGPRLAAAADACAALAGSFRVGRALRDGVVVALAGPVNAGKSSLFNALVGRERSIVDAAPGTTRDYVEARVEWGGIPVTLIDTAGERVDAGPVEARGIALAAERTAAADAVLWVSAGPASDGGATRHGERAILVRSKSDLGATAPVGAVVTSAVTGEGLVALRRAALQVAGVGDEVAVTVVTSERQRAGLAAAAEFLRAAAAGVGAGRAPELIAIDVRDGLRALAEVTGDEVGEAVLDALFAKFCIGK